MATDLDFKSLIVDLDKEFWVRYPDTQQNFEPYNKIDLSARVVVAYLNNKAVGCGCFRPTGEDRTLEIKRMYVVPGFRSNGIAKIILRDLEQWGREEGFMYSKLETGIKQPEAIAVYKKEAYIQIPNYPPYVDVAESICMSKKL
jgi:GNAT superfamily N-acetyltransferase